MKLNLYSIACFIVAVVGAQQATNIDNTHFRAVTIAQAPYMFIDHTLTGNARYSGLAKDLWEEVFNRAGVNVTYEIFEAPDGAFGTKDATGNWTGTIGQVVAGNADTVMGPLTILSSRIEVLDFTTSFTQVGLEVMINTPKETVDSLSFLKPFSKELWVLLLFTALIMTFVIYGIDRFSPYGYRDLKEDNDRRKLNVPESLFSAYMAIIGRGSSWEEARSWSTRIMLLSYFFFIVIITASYTANLTAFLTVKRLSNTISSVDDIRSAALKFAVINNSAISDFFQTTKIPEYAVMLHLMKPYPDVDSAMAALRNGDVPAFIHSSAISDYIVNQPPCGTLVVGSLFNLGYYGIPLKLDSPYRHILSTTLLKVVEDGTYDRLHDKWYYEMGSCNAGNADNTDVDADQLGVSNLAGLFYMLLLFFGIALVFLGLEHLTHRQRHKNLYFRHINKFCGNHDEHEPEKDTGSVHLSSSL